MDKVLHGRSNRGERHGMAKLTADAVRDIRRRCREGEPQKFIARAYGIRQQHVSEINRRVVWAWLDAEGGDAA